MPQHAQLASLRRAPLLFDEPGLTSFCARNPLCAAVRARDLAELKKLLGKLNCSSREVFSARLVQDLDRPVWSATKLAAKLGFLGGLRALLEFLHGKGFRRLLPEEDNNEKNEKNENSQKKEGEEDEEDEARPSKKRKSAPLGDYEGAESWYLMDAEAKENNQFKQEEEEEDDLEVKEQPNSNEASELREIISQQLLGVLGAAVACENSSAALEELLRRPRFRRVSRTSGEEQPSVLRSAIAARSEVCTRWILERRERFFPSGRLGRAELDDVVEFGASERVLDLLASWAIEDGRPSVIMLCLRASLSQACSKSTERLLHALDPLPDEALLLLLKEPALDASSLLAAAPENLPALRRFYPLLRAYPRAPGILLERAVAHGCKESLEYLLASGDVRGKSFDCALEAAISCDNLETFRILLQHASEAPEDPKLRLGSVLDLPRTLLMSCAGLRPEFMELLFKTFPAIPARFPRPDAMLNMAARFGCAQNLAFLQDLSAKHDQMFKQEQEERKTKKFLRKKQKNISKKGLLRFDKLTWNAFWLFDLEREVFGPNGINIPLVSLSAEGRAAVEREFPGKLEILYKGKRPALMDIATPFNDPEVGALSLLMWALKSRRLEAARILLERGANPNSLVTVDLTGNSPFKSKKRGVRACAQGEADLAGLHLLLSQEATPCSLDLPQGANPILLQRHASIKEFRLLRAMGCNAEASDAHGRGLFQIAAEELGTLAQLLLSGPLGSLGSDRRDEDSAVFKRKRREVKMMMSQGAGEEGVNREGGGGGVSDGNGKKAGNKDDLANKDGDKVDIEKNDDLENNVDSLNNRTSEGKNKAVSGNTKGERENKGIKNLNDAQENDENNKDADEEEEKEQWEYEEEPEEVEIEDPLERKLARKVRERTALPRSLGSLFLRMSMLFREPWAVHAQVNRLSLFLGKGVRDAQAELLYRFCMQTVAYEFKLGEERARSLLWAFEVWPELKQRILRRMERDFPEHHASFLPLVM